MRVLLFYFAELGGLGGVEVAVVTLAEALKLRGFSAAIVEIARESKPGRVLPNDIPVWGITAPSYPSCWRPRSWASFVRATMQFQAIAREFRPDIVHVHYPLGQCLPVVGASQLPHKWKLIVTVHNSDIRVAPLQEPELRIWQSRVFRHADILTAVSQSLLDDAAKLYPEFTRKARVVHNGVGPRWFQLSVNEETRGCVLYAGRLHTVKGVDLLLTAWKTIQGRCPWAELWLAGDGPERQNLEDLATQLNLSGVRFLGSKSPEELSALYREATAVVLPSRREGLPISLLEAGACGAVCVGSRTPGIPEIIEEGITGYLVSVESVQEIAEAVSRVLALPRQQLCKMRQAARDHIVTDFSEHAMIEKYVSAYQALLS